MFLHYQSTTISEELRHSLETEEEGLPGEMLDAHAVMAPLMLENGTQANEGEESQVDIGCSRASTDKFTEKNHRRIRSGNRQPYVRLLIAKCKARFGVASNTEASRRAVRAYATREMDSHGLRMTEQQRLLPLVLTAVSTPDKFEIRAGMMYNSSFAIVRRATHACLQALGGHTSF